MDPCDQQAGEGGGRLAPPSLSISSNHSCCSNSTAGSYSNSSSCYNNKSPRHQNRHQRKRAKNHDQDVSDDANNNNNNNNNTMVAATTTAASSRQTARTAPARASSSLSASSSSTTASRSPRRCRNNNNNNNASVHRYRRDPNLRLQELLYECGCISLDDGPRQTALDCLERLLAKWAHNNQQQQQKNSAWQRPRVAVIPFGSYRLNVHRPTSDLDVLALAPPNCSRDDFFGTFVDMLKRDPNFQRVHPIPSAYTPVLKFEYIVNNNNNGTTTTTTNTTIPIDMLFAHTHNPTKLLQYQQSRVSPLLQQLQLQRRQQQQQQGGAVDDFDNDNTMLHPEEGSYYHVDDSDLMNIISSSSGNNNDNNNADTAAAAAAAAEAAASVRSLNGVRVTQMIVEMVPNPDVFRIVLRAVKQWAVGKAVYSNVLGFLGGVNCAILVAWVCINHPSNDAEFLFERFFQTFSLWDWPSPVMLGPLQEDPPNPTTTTNEQRNVMPKLPSWNPVTNKRDRSHIMPIITPAYPAMNSSFNVGQPQLRRIQDEMVKAHRLLRQNYNCRYREKALRLLLAPPSSSANDFFRAHKHYLQVTVTTTKGDKKTNKTGADGTNTIDSHQEHTEWLRLVESRLRILYLGLETDEVHAWPYARGFTHDTTDDDDGEEKHQTSFFTALRFAEEVHTVDLRNLTADFLVQVNSWTGRTERMDLQLHHVIYQDLPSFVFGGHHHDIRQNRQQHPPPPSSRDNSDDDNCSKASTMSSNSSLASSSGGGNGYGHGRGHHQGNQRQPPQLPRQVGTADTHQQQQQQPLPVPTMEHFPTLLSVLHSAA